MGVRLTTETIRRAPTRRTPGAIQCSRYINPNGAAEAYTYHVSGGQSSCLRMWRRTGGTGTSRTT